MENKSLPEVWLRGPVKDIPAFLQPVAHALMQAVEDVQKHLEDFPDTLLWSRPGGVASVGFHLKHLTGVLDRLFTYARGESLSADQLRYLSNEEQPSVDMPAMQFEQQPQVRALVNMFEDQVHKALEQLKSTIENTLSDKRGVGRKQLPSTVLGLLFHAAEHTQRHVGQLIVTSRILKHGSSISIH